MSVVKPPRLKTKTGRMDWKKRDAKRKQKRKMLELERRLIAEAKERRRVHHELVEDRRRRRAENELNSSSTQRVNARKVKNMNKKQLRQIKRVSVNADGTKEFTSPWGS